MNSEIAAQSCATMCRYHSISTLACFGSVQVCVYPQLPLTITTFLDSSKYKKNKFLRVAQVDALYTTASK